MALIRWEGMDHLTVRLYRLPTPWPTRATSASPPESRGLFSPVSVFYGAAMPSSAAPQLYTHHRLLIRHAVWLYFRFPLSHRAGEDLLFVRGIIVAYAAIWQWCRKCG